MNETSPNTAGGAGATGPAPATPPAPAPGPAHAPAIGPAPAATNLSARAWIIGAALVGACSVAALTLSLYSQQRVRTVEQELVRRQQDSQVQAIEARALAKQAQDAAIGAEAKTALLEARVAETALQRTQLEELIQQLSRSRDENVLADVDAAIRVAIQQVAITGSAEPLIGALRKADERLSHINQPRLERVRRALVRDADRAKAVAVADIPSLAIKLDEAVRLVDELPLLSQPGRHAAPAPAAAPAGRAAVAPENWLDRLEQGGSTLSAQVWSEVRSLLRVTRIDTPEAMLVAPEQAWFLRENLKLRLLNARLALLSRQFDTAQFDLRDAQASIERYFDRRSRRVTTALDLVRQVTVQARQVSVPRPDETLAAIVAAQSGR